MKKIILFFGIVLFGFLGCNKKTKIVSANQACKEKLILAIANPNSLTNEKIALLLKDCGSIVCDNDTLLAQIEELHKMNATDKVTRYDKYLKDFWEQNPVQFKQYNWSKIKPFLVNKCYDEYITFNYDDKKDSLIELITKVTFTDYPSCYSIPLFKSIELNYRNKNRDSIPDTAIFKFAKGKFNNKTIIVFETDDTTMGVANYDISDIPLVDPPKYIRLIKEIISKL